MPVSVRGRDRVESGRTEALPLVTIVTPSLNQGRYIAEAIDSVLAQDYPRLEHVVVDGGSDDGTLALLERYRGRVRWVSGRDGGQSAAINAGIAMGTGEILGWLNADDYLSPSDAVSRVVRRFLERPELMLVYGDARFVDAAGHDLGPCGQVQPFDFARLLHEGDIVAQPAAFFRRQAFEAVGRLDEALRWAMDYDLWLKMGRRFPVLYVPEPVACYRLTGANKTLCGGEPRFEEIASVARRHGGRGLPAAFRVERLRARLHEAVRLLRAGHLAAAVRKGGSGLGGVASSFRAWRMLLAAALRRLRLRAT